MFDQFRSMFRRKLQAEDVVSNGTARALRLVQTGPHPDRMYLCVQEGGRVLSLKCAEREGHSLLLFTSPYYAVDYVRATGVTADIGTIAMESLPERAMEWIAAGASTFVLNRCPRCDVAMVSEMKHLVSREDFLKLWAINRVTRAQKGEQLAASALARIGEGNYERALEALREIRDHVDCGIPQVYHFIALLAGMQGRDDENAEAVSRLRTFENYSFEPGMNIEAVAKLCVELIAVFQQVGR